MKLHIVILVICLAVLDIGAWTAIASESFGNRVELFFLNVGQGDSELIVMPQRVKLLIDAGPDNGRAVQQLDGIVPWHNRYIDLVMISHAELDHFGGLLDVLRRYTVGAVLYNGQGNDSQSFKELAALVREKRIPVLRLSEGDRIQYANDVVDILSASGQSRNDGALVAKFTGDGVTALFTGDISAETEQWLIRNKQIAADIVKIAHHGSRFSSTEEFLAAVHPRIAVIEVGKNSYGHPTKEALQHIAAVGARMFRTDRDGTVRLMIKNGMVTAME